MGDYCGSPCPDIRELSRLVATLAARFDAIKDDQQLLRQEIRALLDLVRESAAQAEQIKNLTSQDAAQWEKVHELMRETARLHAQTVENRVAAGGMRSILMQVVPWAAAVISAVGAWVANKG